MRQIKHSLHLTYRAAASAAVIAWAAGLLMAGRLEAQVRGPALADFSLEDLLSIQVTSVSKRKQSVSKSAAAVFVITREDIRRSGLTTIPELLRLAPGVEVARIDASTWAITIRGYNGVWANKLLVLVDGRSLYTSDFGNVDWGANDTLIEDIDRIEVIRGPGATLWGANAVNGIINIITRDAKSSKGSLVTAGAGTEERAFGAMRYGGNVGDSLSYRVFAKYFSREGEVARAVTLAQYDGDRLGVRLGGRLEWKLNASDTITVQGENAGGRDHRAIAVPLLSAPYSAFYQKWVDRRSGFVMTDWQRKSSEERQTSVRFYYDRKSNPRVDSSNSVSDTLDFELQDNMEIAGRHNLVWGLGLRDWINQSTNTLTRSFFPAHFDVQLFTGFVQDDFEVIPDRFHLIAGTKIEHNTFNTARVELQPNLRAIWTPRSRHTVWGAVSRALREPTREDQHIVVTLAAFPGANGTTTTPMVFGVPSGHSESVVAYELGYRFQRNKKFDADVATFYGDYNGIVGHRAGTPYFEQNPTPHLVIPEYHGNVFDSQSYGGEVWSSMEILPQWRLSGGYSFLRVAPHIHQGIGALELPHSDRTPENQGFIRSSVDWGPVEVDASLFKVGKVDHVNVPGYNRLDLRVGWKATDSLEFSVAGQNLTNAKHVEGWVGEGAFPTPLRRSAYTKLTWTF